MISNAPPGEHGWPDSRKFSRCGPEVGYPGDPSVLIPIDQLTALRDQLRTILWNWARAGVFVPPAPAQLSSGSGASGVAGTRSSVSPCACFAAALRALAGGVSLDG
jgi:hypothetical protein